MFHLVCTLCDAVKPTLRGADLLALEVNGVPTAGSCLPQERRPFGDSRSVDTRTMRCCILVVRVIVSGIRAGLSFIYGACGIVVDGLRW
jgi:hypothetical protein